MLYWKTRTYYTGQALSVADIFNFEVDSNYRQTKKKR
jgi:hypothetical protein